MEKHAARLIKQFIQSDRSASERHKLEQALFEILQEAYDLGAQFGQEMIATRAVGSIDAGIGQRILQKAKDIVSGIVDRIRELFGSGDEQSAVDILPELISETEIPAMVEGAVMDVLREGGVTMVEWAASPGACDVCLENDGQGPIPIGTDFAGGVSCPPQHPYCRCGLMPVED